MRTSQITSTTGATGDHRARWQRFCRIALVLIAVMMMGSTQSGAFDQPLPAHEQDGSMGPMAAVTSGTQNQDFRGFGTTFSPLGAPRNVIVLKRDRNDGSVRYYTRVLYESEEDTVRVDGVPQQFRYIARYGTIDIDETGNLLGLRTFVYGMDEPTFQQTARETINYDPITLAEVETTFSALGTQFCVGEAEIENCRFDDIATSRGMPANSTRMVSNIHQLTTNYMVNGMTFPDVRFTVRPFTSNFTGGDIRARGIGLIERTISSGEPSQRVIYFNVNGNTGGSLSNTPFDMGAILDGFYF